MREEGFVNWALKKQQSAWQCFLEVSSDVTRDFA